MGTMDSVGTNPTTLDPADSAGWADLRANAHALLDAAIDKLEAAKDGRVWTPLPDELKESLRAPAPPAAGVSHEDLAAKLAALLPYGVGNTHPRFFGWVHGSGAPGSVLPELVAAAMNANCGGRDHGGIYVERQVLGWARSMMGFPADCGALLVSGTSMATVVALKAARDKRLGFAASRSLGLAEALRSAGKISAGKLVGYAGEGGHSCLKRAFDLLGLGSDALRMVRVSEDFTIDLADLRARVAADREAGHVPFAVIGTCGSVNVGAIDDLAGLADFAAAESLWLHVDGAFGAAAVLSPAVAPRLSGLGRADSLAFDFHKWLHVRRGGRFLPCIYPPPPERVRAGLSGGVPHHPFLRGRSTTTAAACWCATPTRSSAPSRSGPTTWPPPTAASPRAARGPWTMGPSSRAASAPSRYGLT